jgi:pimeloyl-ACP methyl ester carboxylesterase
LRTRNAFWIILNGSLLLAACSPYPQALSRSSTPTADPNLTLQACPSDAGLPAGAQCGILQVFEDPSAQTGRKIHLAILRLPALSQTPQPDAVFLLAGGPGQAATQAFLPFLSMFDRIRQNRDLVIFDQRGAGSSSALNCPQDGLSTNYSQPDPGPEATRTSLQKCLGSLQADPRLYTTVQAVTDLDTVRQVLNYPQINLVAVSYGTRLALDYLRAHPERTRSLVLDGVAPPGWLLGPSAPEDAAQALNHILARCQSEPGCHKAFPDLTNEFEKLVLTLESQPFKLTVPDPSSGFPTSILFTRDRFAQTILTLSYAQETAVLLPLLIHSAYTSQDFAPLASQYLIVNQTIQQGISEGLYLSVVCSEDVPFFPVPQPDSSYLPDQTSDLVNRCSVWPHNNAQQQLLEPVQSDKPVFLISGDSDPVTPPSNAALAARSLPNSLQVTVSGMGHNNLFRGCLPSLAAAFIEQASPKLDTACVKSIQPMPFFTTFTGP